MDTTILFAINHCNNIFVDHMMLRASSTWTWLLMGIVILLLIIKDHKTKESFWMIVGIALCILIADQLSSSLIKPFVARLRPCQDPHIMYQLRCIAGRGDYFSFPSSHAANDFAVVTYLTLVFRHRLTAILMYIWALVVCYSRVYLAMHYPSDVLCGALLGTVVGIVVYFIGRTIYRRYNPSTMKYYSTAFTSTGFGTDDMYYLSSAVALTLLYVVI